MNIRSVRGLWLLFAGTLFLGCRQMDPHPADQRIHSLPPPNRTTTVVMEDLQDPLTPIVRSVGPATLRADVQVTDVLHPVFLSLGPGDPERIKVSVTFSQYSWYAGGWTAVRFPSEFRVLCFVESRPPVQLHFREGRYSAEMPRASTSLGRNPYYGVLPNYYFLELAGSGERYTIGRIPVVAPMGESGLPDGNRPSPDDAFRIRLRNDSWSILWNRTDPHYRFAHTEIATLIESRSTGLRLVSEVTRSGGISLPPVTMEIPAPEVALRANPFSFGFVFFQTLFSPANAGTLGPSDFQLDWTCTAGGEIPVQWLD